jgi:hypothetical protein
MNSSDRDALITQGFGGLRKEATCGAVPGKLSEPFEGRNIFTRASCERQGICGFGDVC